MFNKTKDYAKKKPVRFGLLLAALGLLLFWGAGALQQTLKVTDPNDPHFDPMKFEFTDYQYPNDLIPVFKKIFPPGTPKSFVDQVLVESAGATVGFLGETPNMIGTKNVYAYRWKYGLISNLPINAYYDDQKQLIEISIYGTPVHNSKRWENR